MNTLIEEIKYYREKHNLNQTQLASMLGTTQPYISMIENGKRSITIDLLNRLKNYGVITEEQFLQVVNNL